MKVFICCAVLCLVSGCTGIELGGRVGVYRVDTYSHSVDTKKQPLPLKCYLWADCTTQQFINEK
jgi:hypothetical protein